MEILKVLLQHAAFVFRQLPQAATTTQATNPKMILFQALPAQFDRAKYIEVAAQLQIPESTADKQIARFLSIGLITRQTHGNYAKMAE
jgi:DNA-binding MarR family transcriptional regulator